MEADDLYKEKENIVILLSAKCDKNGNLNSLRNVGSNKNSVIDIQLDSLQIKFQKKYVVLGENNENWTRQDFIKIINEDWHHSKSGYSLSLALKEINTSGEVWIIYSDILFRDLELNKFNKQDNLIFVDNAWENRFKDRKKRDHSLIELVKSDQESSITLFCTNNDNEIKGSSELCGIIKLTNKSFYKLKNTIPSIKNSKLRELSTSGLLEISRLNGIKFKSTNISGKYCQLNIDDDLINYFLGTKAESLEKLRMIGLKNGYVLDQFKFTVSKWKKEKNKIIEKIIKKFKNNKIVIRSSCLEEDQRGNSSAGKFESQLSVDCNIDSIEKSVSKVIESYGDKNKDENQVFVQKFLNNVQFSGVAFSRMIEGNGPYFSINISYLDTTQVTAGNSCHEYFINRENLDLVKDNNIKKVILCLIEIENLLNFQLIDMEFALVENKIFVLQIRPLVINEKLIDDKEINTYIEETNSEIKNLFDQEKKIYSLMSDWNPAEIIGKLPSVLSSSIYKYIITEKNWYISRKLDGYKEIKSPLLINILGTDYVDVTKSINSFIPSDITNNLSSKIIKKAYHHLSNNPSLHDKIEFEIIPTCMDLNWEKWKIYFKDELNLKELEIYRKSLIENTKNIMRITVRSDNQKSIKELVNIDYSNPKFMLRKAIILLEEIQNKLAIEFARSARRAFIVTSWLKSALEKKIISKSAELGFYKSLKTISSDFINDLNEKKLTNEEIYFKYGHLRPSSYDIQSKCYLERKINKNNFHKEEKKNFNHDLNSWESEKELLFIEINKLFGFNNNHTIEKIMKESVILREKNKFEFTKLLSASLELIANYCNSIGINRYQASHIRIETFKEIAFSNFGNELTTKIFYDEFSKNEAQRKIFEFIYKPDIFINGEELLFDKSINFRPTYVGESITEGNIIKLEDFKNENQIILDNKIILIENADPGYDYIFGYNIKGLITMYGGSNSHMTIRCSELNVTAVIGIGHKNFKELNSNEFVQINPLLKTIKRI